MMNFFLKKIIITIENYLMLRKNDKVIVALSGGADSVCLLRSLIELADIYALSIVCVHVNHQIRTEASDDEAFCVELCKSLGVPLHIYGKDIAAMAKGMKISQELAGRKYRYEIFNKLKTELGADRIAVGHNKNDNAETLLMRLIRGTGAKGMAGIPPVSNNIIRPLIDKTRDEIEDFLDEIGQNFCNDATNASHDYTRNRIRHELLSCLIEMNPNVIETLSDECRLFAEEDAFLDKLADEMLKNTVLIHANSSQNNLSCEPGTVGISISLEILQDCNHVISRRVVRKMITKINCELIKDITLLHIESILSLLDKPSGKHISLPNLLVAEISYGKLIIRKREPRPAFYRQLEFDTDYSIDDGRINIRLTKKICIKSKNNENNSKTIYTKVFDYDKIVMQYGECGFFLRTRQNGDRINFDRVGTVKLKDYFINNKIQRQDRDMPLLCIENDVLMMFGTGIGKGLTKNGGFIASEKFQADMNTIHFLSVIITEDVSKHFIKLE